MSDETPPESPENDPVTPPVEPIDARGPDGLFIPVKRTLGPLPPRPEGWTRGYRAHDWWMNHEPSWQKRNAAIKKGSKRSWQNPVSRANRLAAVSKAQGWGTEKAAERMRRLTKAQWQDPVHRERQRMLSKQRWSDPDWKAENAKRISEGRARTKEMRADILAVIIQIMVLASSMGIVVEIVLPEKNS